MGFWVGFGVFSVLLGGIGTIGEYWALRLPTGEYSALLGPIGGYLALLGLIGGCSALLGPIRGCSALLGPFGGEVFGATGAFREVVGNKNTKTSFVLGNRLEFQGKLIKSPRKPLKMLGKLNKLRRPPDQI